MAEGFQRGETVDFNVYVRDADDNVLDITGGTLSILVAWRYRVHITLTEGSGIEVLDASPAQAGEGEPQQPHARATLSAEQTATMPKGRIPTVQTKFVDTAGRTFLSPEAYLDDVAIASTVDVVLGGQQGPAGAVLTEDQILDLVAPAATVTVQIPTDYATLQLAIDALSNKRPKQGVTIALNIASGHQPASGILVTNGDYSQFVVTSTDAEVTLHSSFSRSLDFIKGINARMPVLGCLVNAATRLAHGYYATEGSSGRVLAGCGVKNVWGTGLHVFNASSVSAKNTIWTGAAQNANTGAAITAWGSIVDAAGADCSDSLYYGVQAAHGGIVNIDGGTVEDVGRYALRVSDSGIISGDGVVANRAARYGLYVFNGGLISAREAQVNDCGEAGALATGGGIIHMMDGSATGAGNYGVQATTGSIIDAFGVDASGAGIHGFYANGGATIVAGGSKANDVGTTTVHHAYYALSGSKITARLAEGNNCAANIFMAEGNSEIDCAGATSTGGDRIGAYALQMSRINAAGCAFPGMFLNGVRADHGSMINATGANLQKGVSPASTDIVTGSGSTIIATGATGGVSQTVNVMTSNGTIFDIS